MKDTFKYVYDVPNDEWYVEYDNHRLMTCQGHFVTEMAESCDVEEREAIRMLFAEVLVDRIENELNGFFVSAVLSKLFNYGMNWSKEVK